MSATLIGTVGAWGIPQDETGLILETLDFDYKDKEKAVLTKSGETQGYSFYDEMIECAIKGLATSTSAFSGTLTASLSLSNTITDHLQGSVSGARNIIRGVKKSLNIEDFIKYDIASRVCPLISAS